MKLLAAVFLTLVTFSVTAQELSNKDEKDIRDRMDLFLNLTKERNFADMMDYIYPKLFTIATKEQMIEVFNSLETMGIGMEMDEINLNKVEMLHTDGEKHYAFGNYDMKMRMILKNEQLQSEESVAMMNEGFKEQFGAENLAYDDATKTFSVKGDKYVVAVKDPEYGKDWCFLEFDPKNSELASILLSAEVVEKAMAKIKN